MPTIDVDFYNTVILRKVVNSSDPQDDYGWPGFPWNPAGYPTYPFGGGSTLGPTNGVAYYIEESRIKGGYNNTAIDLGTRAYITQDDPIRPDNSNSLIYSGILNTSTGVNRTNVFSSAENIIRTLDPFYGSVQYMYAEDTNLIVFQENKVNSALIDKDALYTAEGLGLTNSGRIVIGQLKPYLGNWGISKNPESFATYGFRKYFVDKDRSAILRLSRDGITEISQYGMRDYFRDELAVLNYDFKSKLTYTGTFQYSISTAGVVNYLRFTTNDPCDILTGTTLEIDFGGGLGYQIILNTVSSPPNLIGARVLGTPVYITDIIQVDSTTVEFNTNGQPGLELTWDPELPWDKISGGSGSYPARLTVPVKDKIIGGYDLHDNSYVVSLQESLTGNYSTVNYDEEVNGWVSFHSFKPLVIKSLNDSLYTFDTYKMWRHYEDKGLNRTNYYGVSNRSDITFIFNDEPHVVKNFLTVDYEGSNGWQCDTIESDIEQANNWNYNLSAPYYNNWGSNFDSIKSIYSYEEGAYDSAGNNPPQTYPIYRAGFDRKENQYVANMVSSSKPRAGEVIFNNDTVNKAYPSSGIKGYYCTVKFSIDKKKQFGGKKELFSVGTRYVTSSY